MGLIKLLAAPVTAPVASFTWVLRTLRDEAERQYYDTDAINRELSEVQERIAAEELTAEEGEQLMDDLLQRLIEARDFHLAEQQEEEM